MVIRVVIADDEPVVRAGLVSILTSEPDIEVVAEAVDGASAVELVAGTRPDLALLDVRMPGMSGVEAAEAIGRRSDGAPPTAILMLTTFNSREAVFAALQSGASGFLLKDSGADTLVAAVRAVAAGEGWLSPAITRDLIRQFVHRRGSSDPGAVAAVAALTEREREVLGLLASGLSNAEIAAHLFVGEGTVKTHVSHILAKLGLRDRTQAVTVAFLAGVAPMLG